jgi:hypothetical protein
MDSKGFAVVFYGKNVLYCNSSISAIGFVDEGMIFYEDSVPEVMKSQYCRPYLCHVQGRAGVDLSLHEDCEP